MSKQRRKINDAKIRPRIMLVIISICIYDYTKNTKLPIT